MDRSNWRNDYTIEKPERTVAVNYSRGIFKSISLEKEGKKGEERVVLKVQKLGSQNEVTIFDKSSYLTITESLKKLVQEGIYRRWITDPKGHTGLIESAAVCLNVSSFYLNPGIVKLSSAEESFIHQARTRTTVLGGDWFGKRKEVKGEEWCYQCMNGDLDLFHVISNCEERMDDITARHNSVLDFLEEGVLLGTKSGYKTRKDKLVYGSKTPKRPDFVIRKNWSKDEDNEIVIVDVTCPHNVNPERLDACHQDKEDKYTFIQQELKEEYPLAQVHLHSLVVEALGSWRRENFKTFEALGIPKEYHLILAQLMAKSVIGWSYYIYEKALNPVNCKAAEPKVCKLVEYIVLGEDTHE